VLGAVVLGHSIQAHAVQHARHRVCLTAGPPLPRLAVQQLEAANWSLHPVPIIANPHAHHPSKLTHVYSKLSMFGLPYERAVFLDADTLVVSSTAEALFDCPAKLCAVLRHSERFNSGVLSLQPSPELLDWMATRITSTESYTGGDQGFLNSLYPEMASAQLWQPGITAQERSETAELARLRTGFNADWGLHALSNRWPVAQSELAVLHFTLGPLKPWQWWTAWLTPDSTSSWGSTRRRAAPGMLGWPCSSAKQAAAAAALLAGAAALTAAAAWRGRRLLLRSSSSGRIDAWLVRRAPSAEALLAATPAAVLAAGSAAAAAAAACCPRRAQPAVGMLLWQAYTTAVFVTLCGAWLALLHSAGSASPSASPDAAAAAAARTWRVWAALQITWTALLLLVAAGATGLLTAVAAAVAAAGGVACAAAAEARPVARLWIAAGSAAAAAASKHTI